MPYGEQVLWPDHCVQATPGADFHPDLAGAVEEAHLIVRKGYNPEVDSYSAFFENDKATTTGLGGWLRDKGVKRCFFVGLAYDFCVAYSALDAAQRLGLEAVVLKDLTRAIAMPAGEGTTVDMAEAGFREAGVPAALRSRRSAPPPDAAFLPRRSCRSEPRRGGGLAAGEHVVRLEKLTESQAGGGRFLGFTPAAGGAALQPPRRARQIEYIGDSYTVGYGNTSPRRECTPREVHATTDTQQAFGPLVARRFDADYRIVAYSGFGIVRNYGGRVPELSLPGIYERLAPDAPRALLLPDPHWRPLLIVVNLGTNDFSTPLAPGERWRDAAALRADYRSRYAAFLRSLDVRHSQARFVLMGSDVFLEDVRQVRASLPEPLRARVTTLRFGDLELTGCNWHPSLEDNRRLADQLAAAIEGLPDLWTRR
jgi:lysophospholipase L1-like esterase